MVTFQGHSNHVHSAAFNLTGDRILTFANDNTTRLWDLSGTGLATFCGTWAAFSAADTVFPPQDSSQIRQTATQETQTDPLPVEDVFPPCMSPAAWSLKMIVTKLIAI